MAMHLKKDGNEAVVVEEEMMELEGSLLEKMFVKSTNSTSATPSTSASSSPSLPPSTPPPDDGRFIFEHLSNNISDDLNGYGQASTTTTATTITLSPSRTSTTANAMTAPSTTTININDEIATSSVWKVPASKKSLRTRNPIRAIVDPIMAAAASSATKEELSSSADSCKDDVKEQISLALGDPTIYGNIPHCPAITAAITTSLQSSMSYGYINACGTLQARMAIAKHHSSHRFQRKMLNEDDNTSGGDNIDANCVAADGLPITPDDVIIANGVSGALELALTALLDEDTVLLVPRPGFPLYQVIAESHGASVVHYDLLPDKGWECDLGHLESILKTHGNGDGGGDDRPAFAAQPSSSNTIIDNNKVVQGILVNNPSNPTGALYSKEHLLQIIKLAEKYRVPIIADEIYGDMTFGSGKAFCPMANVAASVGYSVPIITASGLGKQYLVPGWRLGWIVFQDNRCGAIQDVKKGAQRLAQVILGASHLTQMAIPAVLDPSSDTDRLSIELWKKHLHSTIEKQASLLCGLLNECHGLDVIFPEGAMYAMIRIEVDMFDDNIFDDMSFMKLLLEEENVVVLPGCAFGLAVDKEQSASSLRYAFRVVFCAPESILREAANRISSFCLRHRC